MRFMLDTNICIHLMQRRPVGAVEKFSAPAGRRRGDVGGDLC